MTAAVLSLGLQAFIVALSGAMSPGSYLTVTVARTLQRGPTSAALMLVGHGLLEAALIVGFAFGLEHFLQSPKVVIAVALLGGAVMLWMGWGLLSRALTGTAAADLQAETGTALSGHPLSAVAQGAVVSLSNPYWTLWWATIGVKLASDALGIGVFGVLAFFVGHELADIAWYLFVISAVHGGRNLLTPRVYCSIIGSLGAVLLYMGARFVGEGVGVHLPWIPF